MNTIDAQTPQTNNPTPQHPNTQNTVKAFHANKKQPNFNFKRENKYCTYCKRRNHEKSECWYLKQKTGEPHKFTNFKNKYRNNSSQLVYEENERHLPKQNSRDRYPENVDKIESQMRNMALVTSKIENQNWIIDSGSSSHITYNEKLFTNLHDTCKSEVVVANGNVLTAHGSGEIQLINENSPSGIGQITLKDVLYVPELRANLFSVRKATQNGCEVTFSENNCKVMYNNKVLLKGKLKNNLYELQLPVINNENYSYLTNICNNRDCITLWHKRMGHKNFDSIREIRSKQLVEGININDCKHEIECEACIKSKMSDAPYPKFTKNRGNHVLELVHTDVCGPMSVPTIGGKYYVVTFIDDYSRYTMIYLMSKKSEVFSKLKEYIKFTSNKFGKIPETLRSDNGGEYINNEIEEFLKENGIHHQLTVPYCPSQNGVAERKNRTLIEMTRTMLSEANLDKKFWGEAINTANYLQNRLPTKTTNKTPYELWMKRKPNLKHLKVFGCKAYAYVHKSKRGKLDDRAEEGIFVGYDNNAKAYRIYVGGKTVTIARTVKFIENPVHTNSSQQIIKNEKISENPQIRTVEVELHKQTDIDESNTNDTNCTQPRRSERSNKGVPPDRLSYLAQETATIEPRDYNDFLEINNPIDKQNWINAMNEEMESLTQNNTFTLVDPPQNRKIIGSKWTYKIKYDSSGKIAKYKARLVAKGFSQKFGEDYYETFAPVVSHTTVRAFLASAVHRKDKIYHIDIKTAFLHGDLEEELYMKQPDGFIKTGTENKVWKLNKAIYGLKQAARAWHQKIGETLRKLNFQQSTADQCLYKRIENNDSTYIIIYVDDILISGSDQNINSIIKELQKEYTLKNLGEISDYLGIKIRKDSNGNYFLNQKHKIDELCEKFNLKEAKHFSTPMDSGYFKNDFEDNKILPNNTNYRQAIGSLLYIATITRPDIMAATSILSRRNECPRQCDWNATKRIITYLRETKNLELKISVTKNPTLKVFADSDFAGDKTDRKSTSGNLFLLDDSPIGWISKKQNCVALSSAEAEYISASHATKEITWLLHLLEDLGMPQKLPIIVYDDNQSAIKMIESRKFMCKTKHVDVKYHAIRDAYDSGTIELKYTSTKDMTADLFTKPLPKIDFLRHRSKLLTAGSPNSVFTGEC